MKASTKLAVCPTNSHTHASRNVPLRAPASPAQSVRGEASEGGRSPPPSCLGDCAWGARATHVRLQIGHQITLEVDDDLVVLDVPVADGGQAPEAPALVGDRAPTAIDETAAAGHLELLVLLVVGPAEREDLLICRLARRDAAQRLLRQHDAGGV